MIDDLTAFNTHSIGGGIGVFHPKRHFQQNFDRFLLAGKRALGVCKFQHLSGLGALVQHQYVRCACTVFSLQQKVSGFLVALLFGVWAYAGWDMH
jgi:hypothetical protein